MRLGGAVTAATPTPRNLFHWFHDQIYNYNLFIPEDDTYIDNDDELIDPPTILKHQKYATWLYVLLLVVSLYILFFIAMVKPQSRTIVVSKITPSIFKELYLQHAETLSCPCSIITMSYKSFISNAITFHPVCSSFFVSQQWIKALYLTDASTYGASDFRTTASSQFQLLASLCSISQDATLQNQIDLDNNEFVSIYLLSEDKIRSEVDATIKLSRNSISTQINSFLSYIKITTRANYLISALNTNAVVGVVGDGVNYVINRFQTFADNETADASGMNTITTCGSTNLIKSAGFYTLPNNKPDIPKYFFTLIDYNAIVTIDGFFAGCTPFEGLLPSTLNCLYDIKCLMLLFDYFPILNQMHSNWTDSVLSSKQENISLNNYLLDLFIEEWSTEMNYSIYFDRCACSFCTYTTTDQTNVLYAMALLISLYGGLIIVFRLIAPFLINIAWKLKHCSKNITVNSEYNATHIRKFAQKTKQLNLFKDHGDRTEAVIMQQKIITRVYLILLTGSLLVLLLFTSLSTQTTSITISNPSLIVYKDLQMLYSNTLNCPCSTMAIPYRTFIKLSPIFHQVCSSDIISESLIAIMTSISTQVISIDWLNQAGSQFQLLSDLCQMANKTIDNAINNFIIQFFVTSNVLNENEFDTQLNVTLNQFIQSTNIYFSLVVNTIRLLMQVDQPYMGVKGSVQMIDTNLIIDTIINETNGQQPIKLKFSLTGTRDINTTSVNCICATNSHCQSPIAIYNVDMKSDESYNFNIAYVVPGFIQGCFAIDSLLLSTLECFYSNSDCLSIIKSHIKSAYIQTTVYPSSFDIRPLIYNPKLNRFTPNTSIEMIVKDMMIEKWNTSISYKSYYEFCAPNYCTYSFTIRAKNTIGVMITLLSMIGGLTVSLRLITPQLVKFVFRLFKLKIKRQHQSNTHSSVHVNWFHQLRTMIQQLARFLYITAINLNIFPLRSFGSRIDRISAKHLGQWATRLYIILLIIGVGILTVYSVIQPETMMKTFNKPSFSLYNDLQRNYGNNLECPCSLIASTYDNYVTIQSRLHQICSSTFISNEWRNNLTMNLISNLSIYDLKDYRRFLSAHLQYLTGLCELVNKSVNTSIHQLLSSLFITTKLQTEIVFHTRINSLIEQSKSNAPKIFSRLFDLVRSINHGNRIVSTYGTNFDYIAPFNEIDDYFAYTYDMIYDNNCSCTLYQNCTSQANFIKINSSEMFLIKGLKIGCTPSESFHASTLECFYDSLCINSIEQYMNSINSSSSLSTSTISRFSINTTINELIDKLFIEEWIISINYSLYFQKCLPLFCSYTYIQQFNLLYAIAFVLGIQSGLTIILKWICPQIVRILAKIYHYRKRRVNTVQPFRTIEITTIEPMNTIIHNRTFHLESTSTNVISQYVFFILI
ncbi:hypothetical protein I4U23_017226 [Adineta vaga]|nr:hypothetical protein I4U23_017226 [Adineta vaga]